MASTNEILQRIGFAVLDTVKEAGAIGAPGGVLYAALMAQGATLNQYQSFMDTLTKTEMLTLDDDCYTITEKGLSFLEKLRLKFGVKTKPAEQCV